MLNLCMMKKKIFSVKLASLITTTKKCEQIPQMCQQFCSNFAIPGSRLWKFESLLQSKESNWFRSKISMESSAIVIRLVSIKTEKSPENPQRSPQVIFGITSKAAQFLESKIWNIPYLISLPNKYDRLYEHLTVMTWVLNLKEVNQCFSWDLKWFTLEKNVLNQFSTICRRSCAHFVNWKVDKFWQNYLWKLHLFQTKLSNNDFIVDFSPGNSRCQGFILEKNLMPVTFVANNVWTVKKSKKLVKIPQGTYPKPFHYQDNHQK